MKNKNLLIAAGLMCLATACKENDTVGPATKTTQIEISIPQAPRPDLTDGAVIEMIETRNKPSVVRPAPGDSPPQSVETELLD